MIGNCLSKGHDEQSPMIPHIFVWGSCFWFCIPPSAVRRPPPVVLSSSCHHTPLAHTQLVHTQLVHTPLVITQLVITPLVIPPLVITPLVITQLVITPLAHTSQHHNNLSTCPHTTSTCPSLCLAGKALCAIHLHFVWQAWHFVTSTFTLCGRRGTWRHRLLLCVAGVAMALGWLWWHAWSAGGAVTLRRFAWAGVALCDIHLRFVWQVWHLTTSIVTLRGRRGTYGTGLALVARLVSRRRRDAAAFCVAGVALCDIHLHFVWQAWHLTTSIVTLRGRRGTYGTGLALVARLVSRRGRDAVAFCVAGVALCDIHLRFVWQVWHLTTSIVTLRGRRGTYGTGLALVARLVSRRRRDAAAFCVAGVALCDIHLHFVWQAWHLTTSIVTLRGRRGTYGTGPALVARLVSRRRRDAAAFCVAGVALCDIHLHFVWQAWALDDIDCYFAWQAWHLWHWVGPGGALGQHTLRGRRGTHGTGPALVARLVSRRRRDAAAFCVAGVALCDIHLHFVWQAWHLTTFDCYFAWQAWHLWHWVGPGGALGQQAAPWRRGVLRGQPWHFVTSTFTFVWAGVALDDIDCYFAWQAWHCVTSTFTLCGRRGTWRVTLSWTWSGLRVQYIPFIAKGARA